MKIKIACVGKIKESFYREAIAEYSKRLSRFCKLEIVEVAEELRNNLNDKNLQAVKVAEGQRLESALKGFVIALDINGKQLASESLAAEIDALTVGGVSEITFVIGGSYGLSESVLKNADMLLSFG
ncbi:MAG: 23S rRNA (pseudouridine(1915)-N(3))-methyltransferase RlmH, partial [Clostridia bacterium]